MSPQKESICSTSNTMETNSDSEFEHQPTKGKTGHSFVHLKHQKPTENYSNLPLKWEELPADMQSVFPPDDSYTYVIQLYTPEDTKCFDGAPSFSSTLLLE